MDEAIKNELEQEEPTDFHKQLLMHVKALVEMSARRMADNYDNWDSANQTYRGEHLLDKADKAAVSRNEPTKMVVPLTYAQVQTFVAFCMSLFTQRDRIFELVPKGEMYDKAAKAGEAILSRDLTQNVFEAKLYQFLLDIARFGLGVMKTAWVNEQILEDVTITSPGLQIGPFKMGSRTSTVKQMVTKYQGNRIYNISPYRFYPDVRLPLSRFQEGEFCASEDDYSMIALRQLESDGVVAGMKWVKPLTGRARDTVSQQSRRYTQNTPLESIKGNASSQSPGMAVVTEVQVSLIPSEFKINGKPMGPETSPTKYLVWYANDCRVIKCEPLGYKHNQFTYDLAEFSPDMHNLVNDGLAGTIDQLQSVITWLINSHITSVRKTIQNWLIVDPAGIEMKDIVERKPIIRMKPERAGQGVDKFVKQLALQDVTGNHIGDALTLHSVLQIVTGINENALGQFHAGRRSATEARNVNSATAARLKMIALLIFRTSLETMARKMLSNLQDGLDVETYVQILSEAADPQAYVDFTKITKADLVGDYDFEVFDGTLPSERGLQAQALGEFIMNIAQNPQMIPVLGFDPLKIVLEWLELRGIRNPKRFLLDQVKAQLMMQQLQTMGGKDGSTTGEPGVSNGAGAANSIGAGGTPPAAATGGGPDIGGLMQQLGIGGK